MLSALEVSRLARRFRRESELTVLHICSFQDLGGIYIKLGQHLSSVAVIPIEWSTTSKFHRVCLFVPSRAHHLLLLSSAVSVLQDRCPASSLSEIDDMIKMDTGKSREVYCESLSAFSFATLSTVVSSFRLTSLSPSSSLGLEPKSHRDRLDCSGAPRYG